MFDYFSRLFDTSAFPPRWSCGDWTPLHGWVHVVADIAVFGAYTAIPLVLAFFLLRRRPHVPFPRVGWLFVAFIFACGTTHLIEATIFWHPWYRFSALAKLVTAVVSWSTVAALVRVGPKAMSLRSPSELEGEVEERTIELSRTRDQLEEEVAERRRAEGEAEAASRAKSQFLARMSHEVRTPMAAILGHAELLAGTADGEEQRAQVRVIRRNGEYLLEILDDLLDLARIEADRLDVDRVRFSIVDVVNDVVSLLSVRAAQRGLSLAVEWEGPIPISVESDPVRVRQILINLVSNAIKYTDEGGIRVVVGLASKHDGAALVRVRVHDTGIGIRAEDAEAVFAPFAQGSRSRSGVGLGLAISRRLARMLGGDVTLESNPGPGSTFDVTIDPGSLEGIDVLPIERHVREPEALDDGVPASLDARVLVADDAEDVRSLVSSWVAAAGGSAAEVSSGDEAVEAVHRERGAGAPFDAIVMDVHMPGTDGLEATRRLRHEGYSGVILALTAQAMRGDRERCLDAGCDDYITKPARRDELIGRLASLLAERRGIDAGKPHLDSIRRVLVVDDHEDMRRTVVILLTRAGHQVREAAGGMEAVAAVGSFRPHVVLLDLGLPDLDGWEVCKRIRGLASIEQPLVLALSGRGETEDLERSEIAGFDGHLLKTTPFEKVLSAVLAGRRTPGTPSRQPERGGDSR